MRRENGTIHHTIPLNDLRVHSADYDKCWCKPRLDEDGNLIHNAADGRERYEQGRARKH
jgi:hypothetical protein